MLARRRSVPWSVPLRWAQSAGAARCSVPAPGGTRRWCCAVQRPRSGWHEALVLRGAASPSGVHTALAPQWRPGWVARRGVFLAQAGYRPWRWRTGHCVGQATCDPYAFPVRAENPPQVSGGSKRAAYSAPHGACLSTRSGTGRQHAGDRHDEGANPPRRSADRRAISGPTAGGASHKHVEIYRAAPVTGQPFRDKGARGAGASAGKPRPSVSVQACLQFP